jgi:hypothetical protein
LLCQGELELFCLLALQIPVALNWQRVQGDAGRLMGRVQELLIVIPRWNLRFSFLQNVLLTFEYFFLLQFELQNLVLKNVQVVVTVFAHRNLISLI